MDFLYELAMKKFLLIMLVSFLLQSCQSHREYSPYGHPQTQSEYRKWVSDSRENFLRMQEHRQFQQQQPIPHRSDAELYQSYSEYQSVNYKRSREELAKRKGLEEARVNYNGLNEELSQTMNARQRRYAKFISHRSSFQKKLNQKQAPETRLREVDRFMTQQYKNQKAIKSK